MGHLVGRDEDVEAHEGKATTAMLGIPIVGPLVLAMADLKYTNTTCTIDIDNRLTSAQLLLEDCPDLVVDLLIIIRATEDDNLLWFYLSLVFSCFEFLVCILVCLRRVMAREGTLKT